MYYEDAISLYSFYKSNLVYLLDRNNIKYKNVCCVGSLKRKSELVTDIETWSLPTPPKRIIDKVTQQYARMALHHTIKEEGFTVAEEWEMDDNSIELTVTRWV